MVEHDPRRIAAAALDQPRDEGEEPVVGDLLVVERRQQKHGRRADLAGMAGERDRIAHGAGPGARQEPLGGDARLEMGVDHPAAFVERQRVRLAGRAEDGKAMRAVGKELLRMPDEPRLVDAAVGAERGGDRRPEAGEGRGHLGFS